MGIQIIILAAGRGKRMNSRLPKVLHQIGGKSMLEHVIDTSFKIAPHTHPIIINGHFGQFVHDSLSHLSVKWVNQAEQLGTGHAVLQALPHVSDQDNVLILYGDVPLISEKLLQQLILTTPENTLGMLTAHLDNPTGYGRIKRDAQNRIVQIVEEKDATDLERAITEVNPGIYFVPASLLKKWLPNLKNENQQKEYYLTDIIAASVKENIPIHSVSVPVTQEIQGVNDRKQLADLERFYQRKIADELMRQGVTISDPNRIDIRGETHIDQDVLLDVGVILEGRVVIGRGSKIGPYSILRDVTIGEEVEVKAHSIIQGAEIANKCIVGPFARIRPGTILNAESHIGNFVEIKNSQIGEATKINHLSYVGDSEVGKRVNIGAGTITCNYDGVNKHKTIIHDKVFIGSGTQLIAPVTVGEGAILGAGSTVVKDVPAHELTLTHRLDQRSIKPSNK